MNERADVLVIGSGAGGAVTAYELASRGREVLVLEEGERHERADYGASSPIAMERLYRRRGMTPIEGRVPIGYVEGRAIGGSTEINSGFWHRTPDAVLARWKAEYDLADASPAALAPHFEWAEQVLGVSKAGGPWPRSTALFARGLDALGWAWEEVPRAVRGCRGTNACANGCPTGAKQGMSTSVLAAAERAGARIRGGARVERLEVRRGRVAAAIVATREGRVRIEASNVFVCAGPTESPALLRRSGFTRHVGDTLRLHPMLKVAALFDEEVGAHDSVMPLLQVKEFRPHVSLGGSFFSPGHLAMLLGENWPDTRRHMHDYRRMAMYYVAVRGGGVGRVRPGFLDGATRLRYDLTRDDVTHLGRGLSHLATALLAGGARAVFPAVHGIPELRDRSHAARWLEDPLPAGALSLTTVHAFGTCPSGERADRTAVDSFGHLRGCDNLYVNDASILPDSPGVNPQGTIMALARRNALRFCESSP